MRSLIIGVVVLIGILASVMAGDSTVTFFSGHSLMIVVGGTLGILLATTPWAVLAVLANSLWSMIRPEDNMALHKMTLDRLNTNKLAGGAESAHPLIRYACDLWAQGVDDELFVVLLSQKRREIDLKSLDAVQVLKNLSKYPPALGMIGTVMGMIGLFSDLDHNKSSIGQNLSLAMTATFMGLIMANIVVSPLADRLQVHHAKHQQLNSHLYELLLLIHRGEAQSLIEEEINGRAA